MAAMRIDWSALQPSVLHVGRSRWQRGQIHGHMWEPPGRSINMQHFIFIWAGSGRFRLRHGWAPLRPGVCLWLRPGFPYMARQDPENPVCQNFMGFQFVDRNGDPVPAPNSLPPEFIDPPDPEFVETTSRRIVELCYGFDAHGHSSPPRDPIIQALADSLFKAILMELDHATNQRRGATPKTGVPQYERMVRQAILQISENPLETPSVKELALKSRYSVSRFSSIFKSVTGESPERFIVRTRLHRAERLLLGTDKPIKEVAEASGYPDIYFFSHQFKKFLGVTPSDYRAKHLPPLSES